MPGCGRGYDVAFLARPGRLVTGLEYSASAMAAARDYIAKTVLPERAIYITLVQGDFFDKSVAEGTFDLVYDYTFLCALRPADRDAWAARMHQLLRPGGLLVTLMFPLRPEPLDLSKGPPFALSKATYRELLGKPGGFVEERIEDVADDASLSPDRRGLEALGLWVRQ